MRKISTLVFFEPVPASIIVNDTENIDEEILLEKYRDNLLESAVGKMEPQFIQEVKIKGDL